MRHFLCTRFLRTLFLCTLCSTLAMAALTAGRVRADEPNGGDQAAPTAEAQQKAFEEFATPGKQHKELKRLVGRWTTKVKSFHEDAENPTVSEGEAVFRMLMGGRYLQQRFESEFDGQKFTGMGISGYDKAKQKYVGVWIDNMGTGIMETRGEYDPKTHKMVETGETSSPAGPMKMKLVSEYVDDDKFIFTMFVVTPAGEQKMMEIVYTRAKT